MMLAQRGSGRVGRGWWWGGRPLYQLGRVLFCRGLVARMSKKGQLKLRANRWAKVWARCNRMCLAPAMTGVEAGSMSRSF